MKLHVTEDPNIQEAEIDIRCPRIDQRIRRVIEAAEIEDLRVAGVAEGYLRVVNASDVLYAETVDAKTFLYTTNKVLEAATTLSELEARLEGTEFVRASRQLLVNLAHVEGLRPYLGARLELILENGERVVASRQFAPIIKQRIGL